MHISPETKGPASLRRARRPSRPRIEPLPFDERDEQARELLAGITVASADLSDSNIFTTLVRHPGLFRKWAPFGGKLLAGRLPAKDRELLILRTGWLCQSEYEWGQHVLVGRRSGLSDDQIHRVQTGPDSPGLDEGDVVLMRAADELHADSCIGDVTWALLADRYDEQQLIELIMLVGHYHMVAMALNSLGVQRDAGVPGFEL